MAARTEPLGEQQLLVGLAKIVREDLVVYGLLRSLDLRSSGGHLRLRIQQSAMGKLLDRRFAARVLRLDFESRELDTRYELETGSGEGLASLVHRFPYNTPFAEGSPGGRGMELVNTKGEVIAFSDQKGRFLRPTLLIRDAEGALRGQVVAAAMKRRLSVTRADGEAVLDLVRASAAGEKWRVLWTKEGLSGEASNWRAVCALFAMLWN